tara:strand:+ start:704 stop:1924 length:1221 start_codon:yes stop_codon:yes gene_type:complete
MFNELKKKKIRDWCFFDFGISAYPTLILTFFYGAFYAKKIALTPEIGTSNWGFAISIASIVSFLTFLIILVSGKSYFESIKTSFFFKFFITLILSTSFLYFFNEQSNEFLPLIFIIISLVSFEVINLFYNLSLHRVTDKNKEGLISNLGWAFGYLGGLVSLILIFTLLQLTKDQDYKIFETSVFLFIGPFVGLWTLVFGLFHFKNFSDATFAIPDVVGFLKNIQKTKILGFLVSYFFFNNAVISIFAFASMFASFLFGLKESEILFLGVFINLFGILGCLILGSYEDKISSEKIVLICILGLLINTSLLFFIKNYFLFWIISLTIGFFIGPIQAASRTIIVKKIRAKNQLSAFCAFAMFGNICAILGPFMVGLVIDMTGSIRYGLVVIPLFFLLSLGFFNSFRVNV